MTLVEEKGATTAATSEQQALRRFAVVGNPNCGKTTVFNALTGMRQKVGNYPGVTVEKKEGSVRASRTGRVVSLIDLPGLYSLTPRSPDETIARDVLLGRRDDTPQPDGIVNIVDASNLERNLYLTSQLLELGLPTVVVLTMTDVLAKSGKRIDTEALSKSLGVPVTSVYARTKLGVRELPNILAELPPTIESPRTSPYLLPPVVMEKTLELTKLVRAHNPGVPFCRAYGEAVSLLMSQGLRQNNEKWYAAPVLKRAADDKASFDAMNIDFPTILVESRYSWIERVRGDVVKSIPAGRKSRWRHITNR